MSKLIILVFLVSSFVCFAQKKRAGTYNRFANLDTAFARILKDWKAAGFAVAIVERDKIVYAKGFGYKDWEKKIPVTENTVFAISSCTKAFTASLIGLLNQEGRLSLDKPVRTYLPELNFYNNDLNNNVTLRDMMCHRTGIPRYDWSWGEFPTSSKDSLLQRLQFLEPTQPLRSKFQYNNFMFFLQGLVTEKITGKKWEDNIMEKIFLPLDMKGSSVSVDEWIKNKDAATGYKLLQDTIVTKANSPVLEALAPAGSINSSVSDMARWLMMWLGSGKYHGNEVLPSQYVTEAISSQMVITAGLPSEKTPDVHMYNYGLGWFLSGYRGHYMVEHGGNVEGFSASTCFFPSDSIGVVVLCNQENSNVPEVVRNLVADKMLGLKYRDWETMMYNDYAAGNVKAKAASKTVISNQKKGTKLSHQLSDYPGIYASAGNETWVLELKDDSLFLSSRSSTYWLRHYHYDVFEVLRKERTGVFDSMYAFYTRYPKVVFNMNESGNIASLSVLMPSSSSKPVYFYKKAKGQLLSKDSLQKYVGDYNLGTAILKVYIKGDNNLYLFVPGQPEYELQATGNNKFTIKSLSGYSAEFTNNLGGQLELMLVQPNGTFKALKVLKP